MTTTALTPDLEEHVRALVRAGRPRGEIIAGLPCHPLDEIWDNMSECASEIITAELEALGLRDCGYCERRFPINGRCGRCQAERVALAEKLERQLRELADACPSAANGDAAAKQLLREAMDGHWFALVIGRQQVEHLIWDREDG